MHVPAPSGREAHSSGHGDSARRRVRGFLIVQRFGSLHVDDSVEKALRTKLRKLVDTNADPDLVTYMIPSNDDGIRAIRTLLTFFGEERSQSRLHFERLHPQQIKSEETIAKTEANVAVTTTEESDLAAISD